jgi:inhibitor of cysteine peptidase
MKRSTGSLLALLSLLALVAVACGGDSEGDATTTTAKASTTSTPASSTTAAAGSGGTEYTASGPISLAVGEKATIVLAANPTTGYAWQMDADPDGAVVKVVSDEYTSAPTSSDMVGGGGEQRIVIEGVGAGSTAIDLSYARSFEPGEPAAEQANFSVTVS